jgi:fused signal recognition particle receptor
MSIFSKLKEALVKTSSKISTGVDHIFFKKKLDIATLEELEELLISADISVAVSSSITAKLKSIKFDKEISPELIKDRLAEFIGETLLINHKPLILNNKGLNVIFVCGVNGNGKTTTIGKLSAKYINEGKKVAVAACDTFRAAAVEQLAKWTSKTGALLIKGDEMADPASVAYKAVTESLANEIDILFIDTAGRLHNYKNLMDELAKIVRVIRKVDESAPHHSILVIDATIGQNAYNQVEEFSAIAGIDGLIVTKLDGTAKAGVVVGVSQKFALPIYFIGVGEKTEDIREFDPEAFAKALISN